MAAADASTQPTRSWGRGSVTNRAKYSSETATKNTYRAYVRASWLYHHNSGFTATRAAAKSAAGGLRNWRAAKKTTGTVAVPNTTDRVRRPTSPVPARRAHTQASR